MNRLRLAVFTLLFLLVASSAIAAPIETVNIGLKDVINTVEKSYRALTDVKADFFQRSTMVEKQRELRADGQMFLKTATSGSPVMFRFDYFRPTAHEVVSNGKTLWIYLPENRKVIMSDVSFVFNPFNFDPDRDRASNFLQGLGRISSDFQINFSPQFQDIAGNYILELTPRKASVTIQKLFIVVNRDAVMRFVRSNRTVVYDVLRPEQAFPVLSTTVVDHDGNTTTMEFSNIKTNTRLIDQLFFFTIPAGVDVEAPPRGR